MLTSRRRLAGAVGAWIVLVAVGSLLVAGPLRDTDVSRFFHGDVAESDAVDLCADWASEAMPRLSSAGIRLTSTAFDAHRRTWTVVGAAPSAHDPGTFRCRISWSAGAATVYREHLELSNGYTSDITDPR